ncbi:MAG: hypothetical protein MZV70_36070 [Desulfobacterales bacterium]|nr:hypothetical protein [Desulfobacterales bacterium]
MRNHKILSEENVSSPASCGCKSNIAQTLAQMGVQMMLAGNMGQGAVNVLSQLRTSMFCRGCSGSVRGRSPKAGLRGSLKDSRSPAASTSMDAMKPEDDGKRRRVTRGTH